MSPFTRAMEVDAASPATMPMGHPAASETLMKMTGGEADVCPQGQVEFAGHHQDPRCDTEQRQDGDGLGDDAGEVAGGEEGECGGRDRASNDEAQEDQHEDDADLQGASSAAVTEVVTEPASEAVGLIVAEAAPAQDGLGGGGGSEHMLRR